MSKADGGSRLAAGVAGMATAISLCASAGSSLGQVMVPPDIARLLEPSVVRVFAVYPGGIASGTGFVIAPGGLVVTNHHVIARVAERGGRLEIALAEAGQEVRHPAELTVDWPDADLALLAAPAVVRPPVTFAASSSLDAGSATFGLGFPGAGDRLGPALMVSFASGTVSRTFEGRWSDGGTTMPIIQHTVPINPGNSGGPLVNACGQVVGMNTQREVRAILGPGGVPLVSDAIQGIFLSASADMIVDHLRRQGIPIAQAGSACAITQPFPWMQIAVVASSLLAATLAVAVLMARRPRPLVNLVVRCEAMAEDCVQAIRRALATVGGWRRVPVGDSAPGKHDAAADGAGPARGDRFALAHAAQGDGLSATNREDPTMAKHSSMTDHGITATAEPTVRTLHVADLKAALAAGFDDFKALRTDVIFLAIIYPILGLILARLAAGYDMLPLVFPLVSGFALVGPFAALGLYELSRRREQGLESRFKSAFDVFRSPSLPAIAALAIVLTTIFVMWLATAMAIYDAIFGGVVPDSIGGFLDQVFTTAEGWALIAIGVSVGFVFAVIVLTISVVSFPLLLDRRVGALTAVRMSMRVVLANPRTMALWGLTVAVLLVLGMIPLFIGLAVVVPVLGHATWHLYRRAVDIGP